MAYRIREIRKEQHLSQKELSKLSGVSRATISGLESGKIIVTTTETLRKLAAALGKEPGEIFLS